MTTNTSFAPSHPYKYNDLVMTSFVAALLLSGIMASKTVDLGPVSVGPITISSLLTDGAFFLFPLVYILGDIMTEVYGYRYAKKVIWTGFVVVAIATVCLQAMVALPPSQEYLHQAGLEGVFDFVWRIVLASLAAYLVGSWLNAKVLDRMKARTDHGERSWWRFIVSSFFGQLVDTTVFGVVAFAFVFDWPSLLMFILIGFAWKFCVELVLVPFVTMPLAEVMKRREGVDGGVPIERVICHA